jgi:hypothetical protein
MGIGWHERVHKDPANRWIRDQLAHALRHD